MKKTSKFGAESTFYMLELPSPLPSNTHRLEGKGWSPAIQVLYRQELMSTANALLVSLSYKPIEKFLDLKFFMSMLLPKLVLLLKKPLTLYYGKLSYYPEL